MKNIFIITVLILCLSLTGCSSTDETNEKTFTSEDLIGKWYVQTDKNQVDEPQEADITWIFNKDGSFLQSSETEVGGVKETTSELVGTYKADDEKITCHVTQITVDAMTISGKDIPEEEQTVEYEYKIKIGPEGEEELTVKNLATELTGIYFKEK